MEIKDLRELFYLDEGVVRHAHTTRGYGGSIERGAPAGCATHNGYIMCAARGWRKQAHRIAWALHYGEWAPDGIDIDHIYGDRTNNAPSNLRLATRSQNNYNAKKRKDNTSGLRGVSYDKGRGKWDARLSTEGKVYRLGRFPTPEAAKAAYDRKAAELRGEYHRP